MTLSDPTPAAHQGKNPAPAPSEDLVRALSSATRAPRTEAAYALAWRTFEAFCTAQGLVSLPAAPSTVTAFLAVRIDEGRRRHATLQLDLAGIAHRHKIARLPSPTGSLEVREVLSGIRRRYGTAQTQKTPILVEDLLKLCEALPRSLIGRRDKALLLLGFATASRREELRNLRVEDVTFLRPKGLLVHLRKSKTDQTAQGLKKAVPLAKNPELCPVLALKAWLEAANIKTGPIFRKVSKGGTVGSEPMQSSSIVRIIKRAAAAANMNEELYSGHSLRAGFATSAAFANKSERSIMRQTGHKTPEMVRRYIREADLWKNNAVFELM